MDFLEKLNFLMDKYNLNKSGKKWPWSNKMSTCRKKIDPYL